MEQWDLEELYDRVRPGDAVEIRFRAVRPIV
jgi:lipoprotein-anchoring transpeptidase ErfK/SrfK